MDSPVESDKIARISKISDKFYGLAARVEGFLNIAPLFLCLDVAGWAFRWIKFNVIIDVEHFY